MSAKAEWEAIPQILKKLNESGVNVKHAKRIGPSEICFEIIGDVDEEFVKDIVKQAGIDHRMPGIGDYDPENLRDLTLIDVMVIIDSITDIDGTKAYLKKISNLVLYLFKRDMEEV